MKSNHHRCPVRVFAGFIALFMGASTSVANAQVNTDTLQPGPPREGLSAGLNASIMQLGGNIQLLDVGLGGRVQVMRLTPAIAGEDASRRGLKQLAYLMGNFRYTARETPTGTVPIMNQALLHGRFIHMWNRHLGSAFFVQHQFNEFQRMRVRSIWGSSLSTPLIQLAWLNVQLGSGYMFEYNRISVFPGASDPDQTFEHRWSNFLGIRMNLFGGKLLAQNTIYMQPRWDRLSDFRFLEEIEFLANVNQMVGFGATFSFLYDSAPPTGVLRTDTRISTNVRFSF